MTGPTIPPRMLVKRFANKNWNYLFPGKENARVRTDLEDYGIFCCEIVADSDIVFTLC